jgi:hypothetical protein
MTLIVQLLCGFSVTLAKLKSYKRLYIGKNFKKDEVIMTVKKWRSIQEDLGFDDAGRAFLEVKEQRSGEVINVPPGWPHSVQNLRVSILLTTCFIL